PCRSSIARKDAGSGWQVAEIREAPAGSATMADGSPEVEPSTHCPSVGSVNAGNETLIRPSSVSSPEFLTLTVTVNVCPNTIAPGLAIESRNWGFGWVGGGGGGLSMSNQVGAPANCRSHVSLNRDPRSQPPNTTIRSLDGSRTAE